MKIEALSSKVRKIGRGVYPCAKEEKPTHRSMSQGEVMFMAISAVISASALTLNPTM